MSQRLSQKGRRAGLIADKKGMVDGSSSAVWGDFNRSETAFVTILGSLGALLAALGRAGGDLGPSWCAIGRSRAALR